MKTSFTKFFIGLFLMGSLNAQTFDVVVRDGKKAKISEITLKDLESSDSFEGKYFKIVKGKEETAVSFNEPDEKLLLKAATAYHHLTVAREYFVEKLRSSYVAKLGQITIRLDHSNQFSELGHYAHDNYEPQFNNALTIPAGSGLASRNIKPWGIEIWFRPSKSVHLNDLKVNNLGNKEVKSLMANYRNQIHMQSLQRFLAQNVTALTVQNIPSSPLALDNVMRIAGSSLMIEMGYQFIEPISKVFSRKWYMLETALVPEIIYHEYAHVALSDSLVLSHSTAIIEGMADFFAGQIANSPKLAMHIKKYNTYNGKNAKRKQEYMIQFEMGDYANTDFVFGLLWELGNILGENKGEAFMYELRKELTTNSSIRTDLIEGILSTCETECDQPFNDKIRIFKALNLRGI